MLIKPYKRTTQHEDIIVSDTLINLLRMMQAWRNNTIQKLHTEFYKEENTTKRNLFNGECAVIYCRVFMSKTIGKVRYTFPCRCPGIPSTDCCITEVFFQSDTKAVVLHCTSPQSQLYNVAC